MATYKDLVASYAAATNATLHIQSMITSKTVSFPAFLTNVSQDFKSSWQSENVFGRNDPIATFQGTTRTATLTWNVPSASIQEARNNHVKFSNLISFLYPAYLFEKGQREIAQSIVNEQGITEDDILQSAVSPKSVMSKSPLVKVKFANLIQAQDGTGLLGWIDNISWKPTMDLGMFTDGGNFFAKNVELSFTLNVLHQSDVGFDQNGKWVTEGNNFPFKLD